MNSRIIKFMQEYQISDLEIEDVKNIAQMIDVTSYEEFIANPAVFEKFNDIFEIEEMLLNVGNRYIHQ